MSERTDTITIVLVNLSGSTLSIFLQIRRNLEVIRTTDK